MRFMHVMLRVRDLQKSVDFYTKAAGMQLLRQREFPEGRFTLAFLGYGDEADNTVIELTHNWDKKDYVNGDAYGHIALGVEHLDDAYQHMLAHGGTPKVAPKLFGGTTRLAFVKDPDGYDVELIERKSQAVPAGQASGGAHAG